MTLFSRSLDRRQLLAASAALLPQLKVAHHAWAADDPILASQRLPEPRIDLPTDAVPRQGQRKRIAAITTAYWKYSHADDIITKFIEGYGVIGRIHLPHCD